MNPASRYTVFGHPVAHSLSPRIHEAFAQQLGVDLVYDTTDADRRAFTGAVQDFFAAGGAGANVTVPHKRAAFELADSRTEAARRVGTANVLTPHPDGRLEAHNTDGDGLVRDLTERHRMDLRGRECLLLGAGGAAHGVSFSLLDAGVARITVVNRTTARAEALSDAIGEPARVRSRYWDDLATIGSYDLILNATSAGVTGQSLELPFSLVGTRALCYDLAYGAAAASFLAWARAADARHAFDGLGMLLETAADAFELWHGTRPSTEPVYAALREAA
jgi:shikimate dehydrogenase